MTDPQDVSEDQRRSMIADAAYFRAEQRGFDRGDPVTDWLEAEAEIDARLRETGSKSVLEELDERLAVANGRLRSLKKKLAGMQANVREEWLREVEKLAKLRDKFQERLEEIRAQGEHTSRKSMAQAEKIWREISDVIERVSSRKSGRSR